MSGHARLTGILLTVSLILGGCAGQPPAKPSKAVDHASAAVARAAGEPAVNTYAPVDLQRAKDALASARAAAKKGDTRQADHLAYLATRYAGVAEQKAAEGSAEEEIRQLNEHRDELREKQRNQTLAKHKREIQMLREQLAELDPHRTDEGMVLTLGDVLFGHDSAQLAAAAGAPLDKLGDYLTRHPDKNVRIEGYTDSTGDAAYNQRLSQRRAQAVADALSARGIAPGRMTIIGYGENYPVASNATRSGRQRNRRVKFVILDGPGGASSG